jgi:hypothetical protein
MSPYEDEEHVNTYFNGQQIESNIAKHMFKIAMHPTYNGLGQFDGRVPKLYEN